MRFNDLAIESIAYELPPVRVTTDQLAARLEGVLRRYRIPVDTLKQFTGILERRFWHRGQPVHEAATAVAHRAIERAGIRPHQVGILINTSVSKDYLEPSMASLVHGDLGLPPHCRNFDLANACLGFLNGMEVAGRLIESGVADYALLVDGESAGDVVEATLTRLEDPNTSLKDFWEAFATLTLGSAAVAMVLSRATLSQTTHRVNGAVSLADTANSRLCMGTAERMVTDSARLMKAGVALARRTWNVASEQLNTQLNTWSDKGIGHYICHQVGASHMVALAEALGISMAKCVLSYPTHGNVGPAAVPLTLALATESGRVKEGDHVALMGIGSGLNVTMMSVTW